MHGMKYLLYSVGLVLLILASTNFYNQAAPPNLSFMEKIYDFLHGNENVYKIKPQAGNVLEFNLSTANGGFFYTLERISFTDEFTSVQFMVKPRTDHAGTNDGELWSLHSLRTFINESNVKAFYNTIKQRLFGNTSNGVELDTASVPFQNPMLAIGSSHHPLLFKTANKREGMNFSTIDLYFPLVKEINNDITIWDHYSANSGRRYLFKLENPALKGRKKGTTVWGFLAIIALFILYQGVRYRPYESLRKNFIKQMKSLYKHKKRALKKAGGRAPEISQEDTRRRINDFYEQARSILFNAYKEEPTGLYRYSRVIFIVVFTLCIFLLLMMLITTSLKVV
ncbi:hypothetical protein L0337_10940 [candidate division KSB1 bacterium]|nr:hypothetical protein [candidate division KSB1 bacterium]